MTTFPSSHAGHPARRGAAPYTRPKRTAPRVVIVDRLADWTISVGGLSVIVAVFGIMAFLVRVVVPLFTGPTVEGAHAYTLPADRPPLGVVLDEHTTVALGVWPDGSVRAFHARTGRPLASHDLGLGAIRATAWAVSRDGDGFLLGAADGSVQLGRISFETRILAAGDVPGSLVALGGGDSTDGRTVYRPIPGGQVRSLTPHTEIVEQVSAPDGAAPIVAADHAIGGSVERPRRVYVTVDASGSAVLARTESRLNLLTRELTTRSRRTPLPTVEGLDDVVGVLLTERADTVLLAERGGRIYRFDARDPARPRLAEVRDVLPGPPEITALEFLVGEQSLVVGGSDGSVRVLFQVESADAGTADGRKLVAAHHLAPHSAAVTAIAPSRRSKSFATADAGGELWLRHSTSEQVLLRLGGLRDRVDVAVLGARDDAVLGIDRGLRSAAWDVSVPHPETRIGTIFGRVWYEGYPEPTLTWQSSSGTDVFEPKLSLVPLIFGTLKATFYSLLFAIPIALFAAVHTSEFVHGSVRNALKPTMEMMASLPSVVLGFVAALVLAPVVEAWLASVILFFVLVPLLLVAAAHVWQVLPEPLVLRLEGIPKLGLLFGVIGVSALAAARGGVVFEALFFGGDLPAWLDGRGTGRPFLFLMLAPLALPTASWIVARVFGGRVASLLQRLDRPAAGGVDALHALTVAVAGLALAWGAAVLLSLVGVDPRGGPVGTYVQRNALVVGFAMGFAVIPIIYTIAEDAMGAVPSHLRAASLACGATPWQTAVRVVIPTAMSGIFAAAMIGLGRAVGETMIVVMAAGNTPVLDWNVFNGLRALSANIAVELPEAVKDGTLYRMLFLAALTLFVMTFVVNTVAEVVRLRFRRRAADL